MTFEIGDIIEGFNMGSGFDGVQLKVTGTRVGGTTSGSIVFLADLTNYKLGGKICFYTDRCRLVEEVITKKIKIFADKGWGP